MTSSTLSTLWLVKQKCMPFWLVKQRRMQFSIDSYGNFGLSHLTRLWDLLPCFESDKIERWAQWRSKGSFPPRCCKACYMLTAYKVGSNERPYPEWRMHRQIHVWWVELQLSQRTLPECQGISSRLSAHTSPKILLCSQGPAELQWRYHWTIPCLILKLSCRVFSVWEAAAPRISSQINEHSN